MTVRYVVPNAAEVRDDGTLVYRLDADPQGMVTPPKVAVRLGVPKGYDVAELPEGWQARRARRRAPRPPRCSTRRAGRSSSRRKAPPSRLLARVRPLHADHARAVRRVLELGDGRRAEHRQPLGAPDQAPDQRHQHDHGQADDADQDRVGVVLAGAERAPAGLVEQGDARTWSAPRRCRAG